MHRNIDTISLWEKMWLLHGGALMLLLVWTCGQWLGVLGPEEPSTGFLMLLGRTLLASAGIFLVGLAPGTVLALLMAGLLGGWLLSGYRTTPLALFFNLLLLLFSTLAAGVCAARAQDFYIYRLIQWIDPFQENEALTLEAEPPVGVRKIAGILLAWYCKGALPLAVLSAWVGSR